MKPYILSFFGKKYSLEKKRKHAAENIFFWDIK